MDGINEFRELLANSHRAVFYMANHSKQDGEQVKR